MTQVIIDTGTSTENPSLSEPAPYYARATPVESRPGCWNTNRMEIIERATGAILGEYRYGYSSPGRTFHPFFLRGKWYALYSRNYTATRLMSLPDCTDIGGEEPQSYGFCPTDFYVPNLYSLEFLHTPGCPRDRKRPAGADYTVSCTCRNPHKPGCPIGLPDPPRKGGGYDWDQCICKEEREAWDATRHVWHFPDRIFGFVAGCIWGDDSSWKIEFLDLSRADEGILKREARFGYIELPRNLKLNQAVHLEADEDDRYCLRIDTCRDFDLFTGKVAEE
jgi:hypothetical protein